MGINSEIMETKDIQQIKDLFSESINRGLAHLKYIISPTSLKYNMLTRIDNNVNNLMHEKINGTITPERFQNMMNKLLHEALLLVDSISDEDLTVEVKVSKLDVQEGHYIEKIEFDLKKATFVSSKEFLFICKLEFDKLFEILLAKTSILFEKSQLKYKSHREQSRFAISQAGFSLNCISLMDDNQIIIGVWRCDILDESVEPSPHYCVFQKSFYHDVDENFHHIWKGDDKWFGVYFSTPNLASIIFIEFLKLILSKWV